MSRHLLVLCYQHSATLHIRVNISTAYEIPPVYTQHKTNWLQTFTVLETPFPIWMVHLSSRTFWIYIDTTHPNWSPS